MRHKQIACRVTLGACSIIGLVACVAVLFLDGPTAAQECAAYFRHVWLATLVVEAVCP